MMLKIASIKQGFERLQQAVPGIARVFFAVDDQNAAKRLTGASGIQLCVIYPTAVVLGSNDNCRTQCRLTFLVLEKNGGQADNDQREFDRYERLQAIALDLLDEIGEANSTGDPVFASLASKDTVIEPMYNFNGYDGWGVDLFI